MDKFLTTNNVTWTLGKAISTILYYERIGKLTLKRTEGGILLFTRKQIERLRGELKARRERNE